MKKLVTLSIISVLFMTGCTSNSTKMAQAGSGKSQAVNDGVHRDMYTALSRETYESTSLGIQLAAEKAKNGKTPEVQAAIDIATQQSIMSLKEFAKKRDFMTTWDRDHERANSYKYVTVDAKLFSEIGILNYLGSQLSDGAQKISDAWDIAKASTKPATTKPAN